MSFTVHWATFDHHLLSTRALKILVIVLLVHGLLSSYSLVPGILQERVFSVVLFHLSTFGCRITINMAPSRLYFKIFLLVSGSGARGVAEEALGPAVEWINNDTLSTKLLDYVLLTSLPRIWLLFSA